MLFGVAVPYYEQYAHYETVLAFATRAEARGFDAVWFADHVALPASDVPRMGARWFEMLTLMANVAAHVRRARLGTDVLVAPYRHPLLAAKMLATLDIVSGGRLIVGVGGGYVKEEFEALNVPHAQRGAYTDECIQVWKAAWGEPNATFKGKFFRFKDVTTEPKPVQKPHPPLWIGNHGPRVLRRVAELGDGWHPIGLPVAQVNAGAAKLKELCKRAGRHDMPAVSYSGLFGSITRERLPEAERRPLSGSPEQVADDVRRLQDLGAASVLFRFGKKDGTPESVMAQLDLCSEAVLPKVR